MLLCRWSNFRTMIITYIPNYQVIIFRPPAVGFTSRRSWRSTGNWRELKNGVPKRSEKSRRILPGTRRAFSWTPAEAAWRLTTLCTGSRPSWSGWRRAQSAYAGLSCTNVSASCTSWSYLYTSTARTTMRWPTVTGPWASRTTQPCPPASLVAGCSAVTIGLHCSDRYRYTI